MSTLVDPSLYPAVRAAIQVDLTEADLPASVIELETFAGAADAWVNGQYKNADTLLLGDDLRHAKIAAALYCAALLAPNVPVILKDEDLRLGQTRAPMDRQKQAMTLFGRASAELALISTALVPEVIPTLFTVAHGYRGR